MPRISLSATLVVAAIGILLLPASITSQGRRIGAIEVEDIDDRPAVAREVLVRWRVPPPAGRAAQLASDLDPEIVQAVGRRGTFRIRSRSARAAALIAALSRRPDVLYAEPNFIVSAFSEPNDPHYPQLWGLKNVGQTVNGGSAGVPGA